MNRKSLKYFLNWLHSTNKQELEGFTLIELLVALAIGSIAIAGLLSIVTNMLQADQKDAARAETQQQTQMALDYIGEELKEAVYVYDGRCFQAGGQPGLCSYVAGTAGYVLNPDANSVPIVAFWKLRPFPQFIQTMCASPNPPAATNCTSGKSYSLVVYYLRQNLPSDPTQWQGPARITRYELTQFDSSNNTVTAGYIDPSAVGTSFQSWPQVNGTPPTSSVTPNSVNILVDSIDFPTATPNLNCTNPKNLTPAPTTSSYVASPLNGSASFYACVRTTANATATGVNQQGTTQDVWLYLTGNASGKTGLNNNLYRPTLNTDVIVRGVPNKVPF